MLQISRASAELLEQQRRALHDHIAGNAGINLTDPTLVALSQQLDASIVNCYRPEPAGSR